MKKISFYIIALLMVFLSACVKDAVDVKLPGGEPKLVVSCFISPQSDTIAVSVTRSAPLLGTVIYLDGEQVEGAVVTISGGGKSLQIPFDEAAKRYRISANLFPVKPGESYTLTVRDPQGNQVEAGCTVPVQAPENIEIELDSGRIRSMNYFIEVTKLSWDAPAQKPTYYRPYLYLFFRHRSFSNPGSFDTIVNDLTFYPSVIENQKTTDKVVIRRDNGVRMEYPADYSFAALGIEYGVLSIDYHYYQYYKSINNYQGGNPFAEPTPVYSNIKGGLGVFGAYLQTNKKLEFK